MPEQDSSPQQDESESPDTEWQRRWSDLTDTLKRSRTLGIVTQTPPSAVVPQTKTPTTSTTEDGHPQGATHYLSIANTRRRLQTAEKLRQDRTGPVSASVLEPTYTIQREWITPERALWLLDQGGAVFRNRNVSDRNLATLVGTMLRGEYSDTGDPVKVSPTGGVIDGQHRLWAIVLSGEPQSIHVAYGVKEEAFIHIDRGMRRSFDQMLNMAGISDSRHVAAIVRRSFLLTLEGGTWDEGYHVSPTPDQLFAFLQDNMDLLEAAKDTQFLQRGLQTRAATLGVCCWLIRRVDDQDATTFIDALSTGANLGHTDPIYKLRERILQARQGGRLRLKLSDRELAGMFMKAWNSFRQGKRVTSHFGFRAGGTNPEQVQQPI